MSAAKEITISVPWGHIAAKTWGSPTKPKLLAVHGLNDNAATFDQLMPLLQDHLFIVCVDLPGHGLSSHFPPCLPFSLIDYACALKLLVDHLEWTQYDILSHSIGSAVTIYYTVLFGENVSGLVLLDVYFPRVNPDDFVQERCQRMLDKCMRPVKPTQKIFDYDESIAKLSEERINIAILSEEQVKLVSDQALKALHKRAFTKCNKGYVFNNDRRNMTVGNSLFTASFHFGLLKCLKCRVLLIMSSGYEGSLLSKTPTNQESLALMHQTLGHQLRTQRVTGSHHVHMDSPQLIAPDIKRFLTHCISHL